MRKRLIGGILGLIATFGNLGCNVPFPPTPFESPQAGALSASVDVTGAVFASQQESAWCWAATIANLFAYYGHPVSQARIVSEVYGAPINMRGGDYSNLARLLNRSWRDDRGRPFTATLTAAFDIVNAVDAITNDQIRDALKSNTPLVMGTTQHAMLVIGMTYVEAAGHVTDVRTVRVFDPWPGAGIRTLSRAEMTSVARGGALMFIAQANIR